MPPVTQWLLIANVAAFLLVDPLSVFALWPPGSYESRFELWQLVTYSFLHGNVAHIFFNMLALYMFGGEIERLFGSRFYALYYFACVVSAAICHLVVTSAMGNPPAYSSGIPCSPTVLSAAQRRGPGPGSSSRSVWLSMRWRRRTSPPGN